MMKQKKQLLSLKKDLMSKKEATDIFGIERENSLKGIIRNIYQTFGESIYCQV